MGQRDKLVIRNSVKKEWKRQIFGKSENIYFLCKQL